MKKLAFFVFFFFVLIANLHFAYAAEIPKKIRIGLESRYKSVECIKIDNKKIQIGYNENFLDNIFTAEKNFEISVSKKFYIDMQKKFQSYNDALVLKSNCVKNGYQAIVFSAENNLWSVYSGGFDNLRDAEDANIKLCGKIVLADKNKLVLSADGSDLIIFGNLCPQIKSDEYIKLGERKYRGIIEFGFYDSSKITAVNILPLDDYLYSVVSSEIPESWHEETIKAQAIVARTYAVKNFNAHKFYDLCDTVHCQMYLGVNNESARVNKIIDQTKNICVYYKDEPIQAVFFSNSGGMTENFENVWVNKFDYLKSVSEINEAPKIWSREFKFSQIQKMLTDKKIDIGNVLGVQILNRLPSGRVSEISIIGTAGEKILCKEEIRNFFTTNGRILESRFFDITLEIADVSNLNNQQKLECTIKFFGKGYGHGVGMSQYGAQGMAKLGFKFDDILKYYYAGVDVK